MDLESLRSLSRSLWPLALAYSARAGESCPACSLECSILQCPLAMCGSCSCLSTAFEVSALSLVCMAALGFLGGAAVTMFVVARRPSGQLGEDAVERERAQERLRLRFRDHVEGRYTVPRSLPRLPALSRRMVGPRYHL